LAFEEIRCDGAKDKLHCRRCSIV